MICSILNTYVELLTVILSQIRKLIKVFIRESFYGHIPHGFKSK